ncbi:translation initiation factor IF-2 [Felis catus]|uniref:translation initiation factor IF-2 n=1 Tax=Felis catus TaxID=9685 RepID=UPI001D19C1B8|nr:translation initiation factor IF-2 [Felis catus]
MPQNSPEQQGSMRLPKKLKSVCGGGGRRGDPKALSCSGTSGCSALPRLLRGVNVPSSGFHPTEPRDPLWRARGRPEGRTRLQPTRRPRVPRSAGRAEAWPIAAASSPGPAAERPEPSPEGPRRGGRLSPCRAAASPARTSATVSLSRAKPRAAAGVPRKARPATGIGAWAAKLSSSGPAAHSPSAGGRAAAGACSSRPQDAAPPPPLPGDSAPSCRRRRCRSRSRGARAPHRSLRASTYRAVRGRRARGRGARPEPSNRLTRECRSQSRGQLRAAPTGSPRDARFCLRPPPRSAPHPRTGPAFIRAAPLIGLPRPCPRGHALSWKPCPRPVASVPGTRPGPSGLPPALWAGSGGGASRQPQALGPLRRSQPTQGGQARELPCHN